MKSRFDEAGAHMVDQGPAGNRVDIDDALGRIGGNPSAAASLAGTGRVWLMLGVCVAFALARGALVRFPPPLPAFLDGGLLIRLCEAGLLIALVLAIESVLVAFVAGRIGDKTARFNIVRVLRLFVVVAVLLIITSMVVANWSTALWSLGAMSVVLGLALQPSLGNLFAWFYILIRRPYRVGDRIRIDDATGDVIDVGYLDTTLWEFGGQYLSTDHPSGRIIKFPNALVLSQPVFNYSWPLFPYIWNEVKVHVAYGSDLGFVADVMLEAARQEIGAEMAERVEAYRELLARTPVDEITVNEEPVVLFRINDNTWVEAIVRYLTEPKQAGPVRTRILRQCLERLNAAPERVQFPAGNAR